MVTGVAAVFGALLLGVISSTSLWLDTADARDFAEIKQGEATTALIQAGHKLTVFKEEEINLETAFMALTKGITA